MLETKERKQYIKIDMAEELSKTRVVAFLGNLLLFTVFLGTFSLISVPIVYFLLEVTSPLLKAIGFSFNDRVELWMTLPAVLLTSFIMTSAVDERPFGSMGLKLHPTWWRELLLGASFGVMLVTLYYGALMALGLMKIAWKPLQPEDVKGLFFIIPFLFLAAAGEEAIFRGYPLQVLIQGLGILPAVLLTSIAFSLLHPYIYSYNFPLTAINVMLMGVVLAIGYLKTKALWWSIGLHAAINYTNGVSKPLTEGVSGSIQFGGDSFTTGLLLIAIVLLLLTPIKPHPQMKVLWGQYIHPAPWPPWKRRTLALAEDPTATPSQEIPEQAPKRNMHPKDLP